MTVNELKLRYHLDETMLARYAAAGIFPSPTKEEGVSMYTKNDCRRIIFIKHMLEAGIPAEALRRYEALCEQGEVTLSAQQSFLVEQREWLEERIASMQQTLEQMDCRMEEPACL